MATTSRAITLLTGPGTSYTSTGTSITVGSTVTVLWQEGLYYYIEYGTVCGYAATAAVTIGSGTVTTFSPTYATRWNKNATSVYTYYGSSASYTRAGSIDGYEQVSYLGKKNDTTGYAFIEYSTTSGYKRAWIDANQLRTTNPNATTTYLVYVSYNANGGSGAPSMQTFTGTTSTLSCTLSSTIPTRSGYNFLGWSTSSTATTPTYYAGYTYSLAGSVNGTTLTLYAVWEQIKYIAYVAYDANGGSGAPATTTHTGSSTSVSCTLSSTIPTRSGYTFLGWSQSSTATSASYSAGGTYTFTGTLYGATTTLYAVWKKTITLSYSANGGNGAPSAQSATVYNATTSYTFTVSSITPTRDGYTFLGWSLSSAATAAAYIGGSTITLSASTTLYAVWEEDLTGVVHIYTAAGWVTATPYIYSNGWEKASPNVFSGSWKTTKEG